MNLGLDNKQIWDKFIGDSGSNLIYKYLNIYLDTVIMGGPPEPIGTVVGSSGTGTDTPAGEKRHACPQFYRAPGTDAHGNGGDLCCAFSHHVNTDRFSLGDDGKI